MCTSAYSRSRGLFTFAALSFIFGEAANAGPRPSELRLYLMPTYPLRLDWSTPRKLLSTSLASLVVNRDHNIGHVTVEVSCGGRSEVVAGAVPLRGLDSGRLLLQQQVGFSLLESGWTGRLESRFEIEKSIRWRGKDPRRLGLVTFLISDETCARLTAYYREYEANAAEKKIYYGFGPRPRFKEGAGCSAFGASFVEVAGLMTGELRSEWTQSRRIQLSMMAGYGNNKVPLARLFRIATSKAWARPEEPHMFLEFFDPDKMYDWVTELMGDPARLREQGGWVEVNLPYGLEQIPAVTFDRRAEPTPAEPIFLSQPRLVPVTDHSVIRADKEYTDNGSFELRP